MRAGVLLSLLVVTTAASAVEKDVLHQAGWRLVTPMGKRTAEFRLADDGAIAVAANGAVGFLYRRLDPSATRGAFVWRWRVDRAPECSGNDRPLAVHVGFPPPADEGLFARLGRAIRSTLVGEPLAGRVVTYVWDNDQTAGRRFSNPHLPDDGVLIVLRGASAPLGTWFEETVDPARDYRAAFGMEPPAPAVLAVSSDTDDRGGRAEARVRFIPRPDPYSSAMR